MQVQASPTSLVATGEWMGARRGREGRDRVRRRCAGEGRVGSPAMEKASGTFFFSEKSCETLKRVERSETSGV